MNMYVKQMIERTRDAPLGKRQKEILAFARARVSAGEPFPTLDEIGDFLTAHLPIQNIQDSLLGLEVRGMIASTGRMWRGQRSYATGWRITDIGWKVYLA